MEPLSYAVTLLQQRQSRTTNPSGEFDKAGRWYPDESERRECCAQLRRPSRAFPYSLMVHCRSAKHVARMVGVDALVLKRAAAAR